LLKRRLERTRVRVRINLRMAVYRKTVRLGDKPLETHDQNFYFPTEHLPLESLCNILSDERMGLSFTIAAGPRQRSHSQIRVPWDSWPHFTLSDSRLPQPAGQVPVFISPRNRVARLYPQALGSYDSQGYGGGIRLRLHTGLLERTRLSIRWFIPKLSVERRPTRATRWEFNGHIIFHISYCTI
jgi:hypothetical protein